MCMSFIYNACFPCLQVNATSHHGVPYSRPFVESYEQTPMLPAVFTYMSYGILTIFGYLRDFLRYWKIERCNIAGEKEEQRVGEATNLIL